MLILLFIEFKQDELKYITGINEKSLKPRFAYEL